MKSLHNAVVGQKGVFYKGPMARGLEIEVKWNNLER